MTTRTLGWVSPQTLGRPAHAGARVAASLLATLPRAALIAGLPPVYDQGTVGSCTAQALAGAVEILHARGGYPVERPDRPALYRRERDAIGLAGEDSGAILADGIAALRQGYESERAHPAAWGPAWLDAAPQREPDAPRVVSAEPLAIDVASVCWELAGGHPVAVGLSITAPWYTSTGELPEPSGASVGGHAVLLVGYDLDREVFLVRNSWGTGWGDSGYAWLPASWLSLPWCGEAHALRAVRRAMTDASQSAATAGPISGGDVLDGPERLVQQHLRASAPGTPPPLAPAVVVTVYPSGSMASTARDSRPILERLMRAAAPGDLAVCVHDPITGDELALTGMVAALGLRLWVAWGANPHVRTARAKGPAAALEVCARWSRAAHQLGAEVLELNGERSDNPNTDWVIDAPGDAALLPALAASLIDTVRASAPGARVSWTSHDHPRWHRLPWGSILGAGGVDLHAPQLYAADTRSAAPEGHRAAAARIASATAQWTALVDVGEVRPDLGPGGAGWTAYGQVHSLTTAGAALILDSSDTSRAWALPTRSDDAGVRALEVLLTARRLHGRAAGAIRRAQAAHGLVVDGVAGPLTCAALGLR